jgi:hypothetical protein
MSSDFFCSSMSKILYREPDSVTVKFVTLRNSVNDVRFEVFAAAELNKIFSGNQPYQLVIGRNRRFGNHLRPHHQGSDVPRCFELLCIYLPGTSAHGSSSHIRTLMMGTEMIPETSVSFCNQLPRLISREDINECKLCHVIYYEKTYLRIRTVLRITFLISRPSVM